MFQEVKLLELFKQTVARDLDEAAKLSIVKGLIIQDRRNRVRHHREREINYKARF